MKRKYIDDTASLLQFRNIPDPITSFPSLPSFPTLIPPPTSHQPAPCPELGFARWVVFLMLWPDIIQFGRITSDVNMSGTRWAHSTKFENITFVKNNHEWNQRHSYFNSSRASIFISRITPGRSHTGALEPEHLCCVLFNWCRNIHLLEKRSTFWLIQGSP